MERAGIPDCRLAAPGARRPFGSLCELFGSETITPVRGDPVAVWFLFLWQQEP
jgi:hypothetical protein